MLINFQEAVLKHNMNIKGIIQVGAHYGQEYPDYKAIGITEILFIEPCRAAFEVLKELYSGVVGVALFNYACGAYDGTAVMNTEQANKGMSNSILTPAKHLRQYPSIEFNGTEEVKVITLDGLIKQREDLLAPFEVADPSPYNMLVMDVQGYELEVLKGAPETLGHIDYIYTEVNRDEVYEGCARIEQIDEYLIGFTRVETSWAGGTWGDAIYVKKTL